MVAGVPVGRLGDHLRLHPRTLKKKTDEAVLAQSDEEHWRKASGLIGSPQK
jgi:hypothetical protein